MDLKRQTFPFMIQTKSDEENFASVAKWVNKILMPGE